jgi:hypothetical protein
MIFYSKVVCTSESYENACLDSHHYSLPYKSTSIISATCVGEIWREIEKHRLLLFLSYLEVGTFFPLAVNKVQF